MRTSTYLATALAACQLTSAAILKRQDAPALPVVLFNTTDFAPLTLDEAKFNTVDEIRHRHKKHGGAAAAAAAANAVRAIEEEMLEDVENALATRQTTTCSNPRIRVEWDSYSVADRARFTAAIKCLMNAPASGRFSQARNRYEDLVSLHQNLTPNVHNNAKFLLWHRYLLWTFEDVLRTECGFTAQLPWFDETRYAGRFSQSSIFSNANFGAIALGGNCVTNGVFAGTTLNVGPGAQNTVHCLSRNGNAAYTANTGSAMVNACNARTTYSSMAACSEGAAHAWGHNGIGAVMSDVYASPGDPVFWLHHAFIDRNFRIWQNAAASRISTVDGTDVNGNPLTLTMTVSVNNVRPDVRIGDILNTLGSTLCYRYDY